MQIPKLGATVWWFCAVLGSAQAVLAQTAPASRPVRPLFGGGPGPFDQSLTGSLSFGAGYDVQRADDVTLGEGVDPSLFFSSGQNASASGSLSYAAGLGPVTAAVSVRSSAFHYQRVQQSGLHVNSGLNASATTTPWSGSSLGLNYDVAYSPIQLYFLSAAEGLEGQTSTSFDPSLVGRAFLAQRTHVNFGQSVPLTRRLSMQVGYGFHATRHGPFGGYRSHEARVRVVYPLAKGLGVRLGYSYGVGRVTFDDTSSGWLAYHSIDSGIDFNRRLSLLRRLTLSFGTGLAAIRTHPRTTHYTLTGFARLNWAINRTWNAGLTVRRNAEFRELIQNVTVGNGMNASLGGSLTRGLSVNSRVGMSYFDVGPGPGDTRVRLVHASVGLNASVTQFMSLGVDYSSAYHSFGDAVVLHPGVPRSRNRHGVRVNISLFAPLYVSTRRQ